ncbi:unnamed protein product [Orchesella dallaii]|uniref:ABC transporter ATP-binding protein n=1 Tax=Orchesella dallaii TaxID=48710 RepID=A0ABP1R2D6_9HEXA
MLARKNIQWSRERLLGIEMDELLLYSIGSLTLLVPLSFGFLVTKKFEPTHQFLEEWLEIDIEFSLQYLPVLAYLVLIVLCAANNVYVMFTFILCYLLLTRFIPDMTVIGLGKQMNGNQYLLRTQAFGTLTDEEVIHLYRVQQLFNRLMNNIMASLLISFHLVVFIVCLVVSAFIWITQGDTIIESGMMCVAFLGIAVLGPIYANFLESRFCGAVVKNSEEFLDKGRKIVKRRSIFRKFAKGGFRLTLEVAYPFFTVGRNTFLEFMQESLGFLVDLLTTYHAQL